LSFLFFEFVPSNSSFYFDGILPLFVVELWRKNKFFLKETFNSLSRSLLFVCTFQNSQEKNTQVMHGFKQTTETTTHKNFTINVFKKNKNKNFLWNLVINSINFTTVSNFPPTSNTCKLISLMVINCSTNPVVGL